MSQFATSNKHGGIRKLPFAFTEQGIYMLMTVLRGAVATKQSLALVRLFKEMKDILLRQQPADYLTSNHYLTLTSRLNRVEDQLTQTVTKSELQDFITHFTEQNITNEYIFYQGQIVEAYTAYQKIFTQAQSSIHIVDNYIDLHTLLTLKNVPTSIPITIYSDNHSHCLHAKELQKFQREYPGRPITILSPTLQFHDRFIILDFQKSTQQIYLCGSSLKDSGRKVTTLVRLHDEKLYQELFAALIVLDK